MVEKLAKLQKLKNLSLISDSSSGTDIISSLDSIKTLEKIRIKLFNDELLKNISLLPKCLSKMESLRSLKLEIIYCAQTQTLLEFMSQLEIMTQLTHLDLSCKMLRQVNDNLFVALGKSLSRLQNIRHLHFSIDNLNGRDSKITSSAICSFFEIF